ncbi:SRPBCC family protein [Falsiroseomonas sp.]|uniref:SRPBCC family protein n=1 Tax=Falsiroseomonas sp. TaxID=2870721 RepID=UPI0035636C55
MAEHHARIEIARPPQEVFAFLADPNNLSRWLPMLRESFREGPDRVRVIGGGLGSEGFVEHVRFTADPGARCVSWATATGVGCAGDLHVEPEGTGATLRLTLRLGGRAERPDALAHWTGDPALDMEAALRATLAAVRQVCEDRREGVPLVSGGTQSHPGEAPLRDSREYGETATQIPASPKEVRRRS